MLPEHLFPTLTPQQISRIEGFVKTGPDLSRDELDAARWPLARSPFLLETTRPGVFAVGDVRAGNVKRMASAVGEGSIAIAFVHQVLQRA
jgi:thioredoxin reductase (NADPH)